MRAAFDQNPRQIFGFAAGLSATALWATIGADMWARAQALGPICGEPGVLDHCPLCWPAAALTAISLASLLARPSPTFPQRRALRYSVRASRRASCARAPQHDESQ